MHNLLIGISDEIERRRLKETVALYEEDYPPRTGAVGEALLDAAESCESEDLARAPLRSRDTRREGSPISMPYAYERSQAQVLLPRRQQRGRVRGRDRLTEHQHGHETRQHKVEPSRGLTYGVYSWYNKDGWMQSRISHCCYAQ